MPHNNTFDKETTDQSVEKNLEERIAALEEQNRKLENQLEQQEVRDLPVTRRQTLAGLLGGSALFSMLGAANAKPGRGHGPPFYNWRQDVDANNHALSNLGALAMADNPTKITNFAGENLSIDKDGILNVSGGADRIDLFTIGGQSNAVGKGDASKSPDLNADVALEYRKGDGGLVPLSDPTGVNPPGGGQTKADTGSAWPAFAQRYYALTGTQLCIVKKSVGSTAQTAAASDSDGSWDTNGTLRKKLVSGTNEAMDALEAAGYDVRFRGILWDQGEADAQAIDNGVITQSDYYAVLRGMVDYYREQISEPWTFGMFETGYPRNGDTDGFRAVRRAQRALTLDDDYPMCAYLSGIQRRFPDEDLMNHHGAGHFHYSQKGYNRMGIRGADSLVCGDLVPALTGVSASFGSGGSQTIPSGEQTKIAFNTLSSGYDYQFDASNNQLRVEVGGDYTVSGGILWPSSTPNGTTLRTYVNVNGTPVTSGLSTADASDFTSSIAPTKRVSLDSGDTVTLVGEQNSGSGLQPIGAGDNQFVTLSVSPASSQMRR